LTTNFQGVIGSRTVIAEQERESTSDCNLFEACFLAGFFGGILGSFCLVAWIHPTVSNERTVVVALLATFFFSFFIGLLGSILGGKLHRTTRCAFGSRTYFCFVGLCFLAAAFITPAFMVGSVFLDERYF
jgi:hypothetical protein